MWKKVHVFIKIIGWNATYNKRNEISWLIVFLLEFMHKSHAHVFTHMYVSSIIWYVLKSFLFFSFLNDYLLSQCKNDKQIADKQLPKAKKNEQNTKHKTHASRDVTPSGTKTLLRKSYWSPIEQDLISWESLEGWET